MGSTSRRSFGFHQRIVFGCMLTPPNAIINPTLTKTHDNKRSQLLMVIFLKIIDISSDYDWQMAPLRANTDFFFPCCLLQLPVRRFTWPKRTLPQNNWFTKNKNKNKKETCSIGRLRGERLLVGGHQVERVSFHVAVDPAPQINDQADSGSHPDQQDSNQTGDDSAADFEDGRPCVVYSSKWRYCKCAFWVFFWSTRNTRHFLKLVSWHSPGFCCCSWLRSALTE